MERIFECANFTRERMLDLMGSLRREQLEQIPEGHRNSIFWNIAHVMVTQQLLMYRLTGLPLGLDEDFVKRYAKGSVGVPVASDEDIQLVRDKLISLNKRVKDDFESGLFKEYQAYMTSTGIELRSIEDAIQFSAYHDGIHLGVILSLKKLV